MQTMFNDSDLAAILGRVTRLQPDAPRQWGKMTAAQMLAHCSATLATPLGDRQEKQALIGRLIAPFVRSSSFGDAPLRLNTPTDAENVIADERDFLAEQRRLLEQLTRLGEQGPAGAHQRVHSFFGKMTGAEWGVFVHKHLDHHLRQFGG